MIFRAAIADLDIFFGKKNTRLAIKVIRWRLIYTPQMFTLSVFERLLCAHANGLSKYQPVMFKKLQALLEHPYFLLPNSPKEVIDDIVGYVDRLGVMGSRDDYIDGPEIHLEKKKDGKLTGLTDVQGQTYLYPNGRIRVTSPSYLVAIREARVLGPEGQVLDRDGRFFAELTYSDRKGRDGKNSFYKRKRFPKPQSLTGSYVTLCFAYSKNWYHWLIQSLPRLELVSEYIDLIDGFIVPDSPYISQMIESLDFFGIPKSKVILLKNDQFSLPLLLVPLCFAQSNVPAWVPDFFQKQHNSCIEGDNPSEEYIYVSREDAKNRRCKNEDQVLSLLSSYGFRSYELSKLSFSDQARLFANAKIVVGAHGSGLANTVFMQKHTQILEIFPSAAVHSDLFHSLASAAGVDYWRHVARTATDETIHANYEIDLELLKENINEMMNTVSS